MSVVIVGPIALDTVETPIEEHTDLLGGSPLYAAVAASFFTPSQLIGVVGSDFPNAHLAYFQSRGIDFEALEKASGAMRRWSVEHPAETSDRKIRSFTPSVLEHCAPQLPESYRKTPYALLAKARSRFRHTRLIRSADCGSSP